MYADKATFHHFLKTDFFSHMSFQQYLSMLRKQPENDRRKTPRASLKN